MQLDFAQRWHLGRAFYRPAGEPIDTDRHQAVPLEEHAARAFVVDHHYEHSYIGGKRRALGLWRGRYERIGSERIFRRDQLVGVAAFGQGWGADCGLGALKLPKDRALELKRLVLLDAVPANGESWFVARAFEAIRRDGTRGVVSFSDPEPRDDHRGRRVFVGHLGIIYRALNAVYVGRGKARTEYLLPDGSAFGEELQDKIRHRDRGWRAAAAVLEALGAAPLGEHQDSRAWLRTWRAALLRRRRHRGRLKYLWGLDRAARAALPRGERYPTWEELRAA